MRFLILILFLLPGHIVLAQKWIRGEVKDAISNRPVPNASIFLNNTSVGTRADEEGRFSLHLPAEKAELIISSVGYQTYSARVSASDTLTFFTVRLQVKSPDLETIVIEPYEKDGWEKWGRFFLENFIGTTDNSTDCKITNPEVIRFRNSKKNKTLNAYAEEPLVIENKALGYVIHYQLESFEYSFNNQFLLYTGYPYFEAMEGSKGKQKRWARNRQEAYYGSMLHFMRCLYLNRLLEEGYEVRSVKKIPNKEKQRINEARKTNTVVIIDASGRRIIKEKYPDSSEYYRNAD
jgi:hypothetical protein